MDTDRRNRRAIAERLRAAGCVFAEDEALLLMEHTDSPDRLAQLIERRVSGVPLEHVLGWAEFAGSRIQVDEGVFVPRRRSELLVTATGTFDAGSVVLDLCCGSGAVAAAIASGSPGIELYASDIEPAAVACARRNLAGAGAGVFEGDLYEALPTSLAGRLTLIVANAPYVPTEEIRFMPSEARDFEPLVTIDGGADGLELHRRIVAGSKRWLAPGGRLLIESSARQAKETASFMESAGLSARVIRSKRLDATVVEGILQ